MDCKFIVFVNDPKNEISCKIIRVLTELGYATFVDGIHGKNYDWLQTNIKQGRLFVFLNDTVHMFDISNLDKNMIWQPDFALLFQDDVILEEMQWEQIRQYCEEHLTEAMIDMTNVMRVHTLLGKPVSMTATVEEPVYAPNQQDFYSFKKVHLEDRDMMLYEVIKPFTDLPYTAVTRNFSQKGYVPFFTDLFICQSWGVATADIKFLEQMWKELNMDGEFNLDHLLKNATEACYPGEDRLPSQEPEVYRRNIYDTIKVLEEKEFNRRKYIDN